MPILALVSRHEPLVDSLTAVYSNEHPDLPHVVTVETVGEAQAACAAALELVSFKHQPARVIGMNGTLPFIENGRYEILNNGDYKLASFGAVEDFCSTRIRCLVK